MFRNYLVYAFLIIVFCSCNRSNSKSNNARTSIHTYAYKYLNVVRNSNKDSTIIYSDEGHTIMYTTDSIGNYIIYYAKYEVNESSKYDMIRDKIVRVELDSCLQHINNIISIHGSAFCLTKSKEPLICCFDEQMKPFRINNIVIESNEDRKKDKDAVIHQVVEQLNNALYIATSMNNNNINGWAYIQTALESVKQIQGIDIVEQNEILNPKAKQYNVKFTRAANKLNSLYLILCKIKTGMDSTAH